MTLNSISIPTSETPISHPDTLRTIKCVLEYDGTDFAGWQRQPQNPHQRTIQGEIEAVLSMVLQEKIEVTGAGRTDSGVHAKAQVAHFQTRHPMSLFKLSYALNRLLPKTISVTDMSDCPAPFHARFDARYRKYRYYVMTRPSALYSRFSGLYPPRRFGAEGYDLGSMNTAARLLLGEHDFSSFSKKHAQTTHFRCRLDGAEWRWLETEVRLVFEIQANRFLHSMVRLIVGTLLEVGAGVVTIEEFRRIFDARSVEAASATADPAGLFLWEVGY